MDRQQVVAIRAKFESVCKQFAAENSLSVTPNNRVTYSSTAVNFKLTFEEVAVAGQPLGDWEKRNWDTHAASLGCDPDWFGKTFVSHGKTFKVVGICPSRSKNCVRCDRKPDGKGFVFPPDSVRFLLRSSGVRVASRSGVTVVTPVTPTAPTAPETNSGSLADILAGSN